MEYHFSTLYGHFKCEVLDFTLLFVHLFFSVMVLCFGIMLMVEAMMKSSEQKQFLKAKLYGNFLLSFVLMLVLTFFSRVVKFSDAIEGYDKLGKDTRKYGWLYQDTLICTTFTAVSILTMWVYLPRYIQALHFINVAQEEHSTKATTMLGPAMQTHLKQS